MLIHCTRKLLDELGLKPELGVQEGELYSWHAKLISINRRKCLVLLNNKNRYSLFLYALKARDFKQLDTLITRAIRNTFQAECINEEVVDEYLSEAQGIKFGKTKNRSFSAKLNHVCNMAKYYAGRIDPARVDQTEISRKLNKRAVSLEGIEENVYPNEQLYKDLREISGKPVLSTQAAQILVTLELDNYAVWRRLVVPLNTTFSRLHDILQIAFEWQDYHLYQFSAYSQEEMEENVDLVGHPAYQREGYKHLVTLVRDDEDLEYAHPASLTKLMTGVRLRDYVDAKIIYTYDFGDNWEHHIEIEDIIENYPRNHPVCLEGEGTSPPEDVGGSPGYQQLRTILADKSDPDHQDMLIWATSQGYKPFDIHRINEALSRL